MSILKIQSKDTDYQTPHSNDVKGMPAMESTGNMSIPSFSGFYWLPLDSIPLSFFILETALFSCQCILIIIIFFYHKQF